MINLSHLRSELTAAARDIFAEMAFLDVLEADDGIIAPAISGPWASIEVRGSVEGQIVLLLPLELKIALIESIYATPWDDLHVEQKDDGLLEILNVLAGHYVSSQLSTEKFLKMSIPGVVFDREDLPVREPDVDFALDAEGNIFRIMFFSSEAKK
jgi:hypothetical protein